MKKKATPKSKPTPEERQAMVNFLYVTNMLEKARKRKVSKNKGQKTK